MYKDFIVKKQSGTYAETLEAFGVANLINEILIRSNVINKVIIEDQDTHYLILSNKDITEDMLSTLRYFQVIKFILKDDNEPIPNGVLDYFDYPRQKSISDFYKKRFDEIDKNKHLNAEQKKSAKRSLNEEKNGDFGQKIDPEFYVYREIKGNPYPSFKNLFNNFHQKKDNFQDLIREVLNYYTHQISPKRIFKLVDEKPTALQLYNPNQGKGLNKGKANNAEMGPVKSYWIPETMKISGSLSMMICQYVKVGSGYDMKIFVPEFKQINLSEAKSLLFDFKKDLKSISPIKLDIFNIINFSIKFIQRTPEYNKGKIKNTIKGFHSVYQKDLGQNKAVSNIAFIVTPDFIEYSTKEEGREWIEILEQQRNLISNIEELGDAIQGLLSYRSFLGSTGSAALNNFTKFSYWYASYLMQQLAKGNKYIRTFKIDTLTKLFTYMESNLIEIIQNDGFKAVAAAIRKSTVSLQYTPKDRRQFEIRYGLAQQLQNKSKSKDDITTFIGEFIATYNAETGRYAEKNNGKAKRANVKDTELVQFYCLLDNCPSRLIGALLASYGFALSKKELEEDKILRLQEEAAKLGFELVKIEGQAQDSESTSDDNIENS